jgi:NADPH-dependent 2,4-dienoyl-CoA reductase/sulfur reductase-like enzyme
MTFGKRKLGGGIVVVGGGLAGQRCAETLRRVGYDGKLSIVCAERHPPYDRPPLSKEVLAGTRGAASLAYKPSSWYGQQRIELLLGTSASRLRPAEDRVDLSDGATLRYDRLLIACGGRPRRPALLHGYENVSVLRTREDAAFLHQALGRGTRLAIVGAGFIGQEVAATARSLGADVTMIEAGRSPLEPLLGRLLGRWFTRLHESEGVRVLTGRTVAHVVGGQRVRRLRLSDDQVVDTDHVVVGVGSNPDTEWLANSGLDAARGVPVDQHGASAIPGVFAAGDAAATYDSLLACHVPGSHWEAAGRQGSRAARLMLSLDPGAAPRTSFWTDQYGLRIQYLGHARLADRVVIDGDLSGRSFNATFTRAGRAVAALLVNRPRELAPAREAIEKGTS